MRTQGPVGLINEKTYLAQTALTRGYFAKAGTVEGSVTAVTGAGQRGIGLVSADVSAAGLPAAIVRSGDGIAIAGAAFAYGAYLKLDAVGRVVVATGTAGGGEEIVARAESTATALGDEVVVFVSPFVL